MKRRIFEACRPRKEGERQVDDSVAGRAANLVVYQQVPIEELDQILCDVDAMRRAGNLKNAPAFFHYKVRELAGRHGVPWKRINAPAAEVSPPQPPRGEEADPAVRQLLGDVEARKRFLATQAGERPGRRSGPEALP